MQIKLNSTFRNIFQIRYNFPFLLYTLYTAFLYVLCITIASQYKSLQAHIVLYLLTLFTCTNDFKTFTHINSLNNISINILISYPSIYDQYISVHTSFQTVIYFYITISFQHILWTQEFHHSFKTASRIIYAKQL